MYCTPRNMEAHLLVKQKNNTTSIHKEDLESDYSYSDIKS